MFTRNQQGPFLRRAAIAAAAFILVAGVAGALLNPTTVLAALATWWWGDAWFEAKGQMTEIQYALADHRAIYGSYPDSKAGLSVLLRARPDGSTEATYFPSWYTAPPEILSDPWGRRIVYRTDPDGDCWFFTLGADGRPGGRRQNEDIVVRCLP